ncbi:hypothetical protein J5N97_010730 [Dioscorea zingiberensis]|uniref:CRC domain-containing protein n=1 Tax=Dioscorea zingiberensis TaxID=325984 RepID=A0A9D5CYZ4_9LILI|nr:hypothetical protein J5N97_010730 [Dioscorea zingiberensis]
MNMDQNVVNSQAPTVPSTVLHQGEERRDCVCYLAKIPCTELCWCKICDNRGGGVSEDQTDDNVIEHAKSLVRKRKEMEIPQPVVDLEEHTQYNPVMKKVALKHSDCRESECLQPELSWLSGGFGCIGHDYCMVEQCYCKASQIPCTDYCGCRGVGCRDSHPKEIAAQEKESSGLGPVPIPGRRSGPLEPCNCRTSECLKIYCQCFAASSLCTERCGCQGCHNRAGDEERISMAVKLISSTQDIRLEGSSSGTSAIAKDIRGCNCLNPGTTVSADGGDQTFSMDWMLSRLPIDKLE